MIMVQCIICSLIFFTSCKTTVSDDNAAPEQIERIYNNSYSITSLSIETAAPGGVLCRQNDFLLCDEDNNCIRVYNYDGELIKILGSTGNGELEFISPTGIFTRDELVYIVDTGNYRVQKLDYELNFIETILFEQFSETSEHYYLDVSVNNDGGVLLTTNSTHQNAARIYISQQGYISQSSQSFYGYLGFDNGLIYAANTLDLFETADAYIASSGNSTFYEINGNDLVPIFLFPYKYTPLDFVIKDSYIYILSATWGTLDKFNIQGEYIETIANLGQLSLDVYMDSYDEGFIVVNNYNGDVFKIECDK